MEVLYARCCGLDVHKSSIIACVPIAQAGKPLKHIRRLGSTTTVRAMQGVLSAIASPTTIEIP